MALSAPTKGGDGKPFEVLPAGTWRGIVAALIDLGTHYEKFEAKKEGEESSEGWKRKIYLVIQTAKKKTDGTPFYIGHQYTLSLVKKANLRGVYTALMGDVPATDDADVIPLLGRPCSVHVTNTPPNKDNKVFANVKSIGAYPADDETPAPPKPAEPLLLYELSSGQPFNEPAWMPRIYGQRVADVIGMSRERAGNGQQAQQPVAAGGVERM